MSTDKLHAPFLRSILRSGSILSLGTLTSRILGFFRDVVLASVLGTGMAADAFFVAFKIPNLFRSFIGEGAVNAVLVPMCSEYLSRKDWEGFLRFVSLIVTWGALVLGGLTLLGLAAAPWIVRGIAWGFTEEPIKFHMAVTLTRWLLPYLFFIGMTAYGIGILHSLRAFGVPAFTPCLLNLALIGCALAAVGTLDEPVWGVVVGVLLGGMLQMLAQVPALARQGVRYRRPRTLWRPEAWRALRLLGPRMVGSGVYQLTVLIDTVCASVASVVGAGGVAAIYFASRLIQFPMGLVSVSLSSAALPELSHLATTKDWTTFERILRVLLRNIMMVMGGCALVLSLAARPLVRILFERGAFTAYSTHQTASALSAYAVGLISYGGIKLLVTAFHALQDTRRPVWVASWCLGLNAVLNVILMFPFQLGGIALASSITATVNFFVLLWMLKKKLSRYRRAAASI